MSSSPLRDLSIADLRRRTSIKWRMHAPDVLPMFVAEMDAHPVPAVVEAVSRAMRDGDTGYPCGDAYPVAFADFAADRWGWTPEPSRAVGVADVMTGLREVVELLTAPGDAVVVNPPVYGPFFAVAERTDRRLVEAPLTPEGRLDLEVLDAAYARATSDGRAAVHLLCSPQNPTSVVHSADELAAVAALAHRRSVHVVVDEIHGPVAEGFVPYLAVPGGERGIVASSASKAFNLAGLKAGLLLPGAEADVSGLHPTVEHGLSHLGVVAHVAALEHGRDWLDGVRADLAENRVQLARLLDERLPRVDWNRESGTYLAWLDLRQHALPGEAAAHLLEHGRVALSPGTEFGAGFAGFARINLATSPELLDEGVARIAAALASA